MGNALNKLTYGLFVLSVHVGKKDNARIINTSAQVASSPDRISISVNKSGLCADMLGYTDDFTLSVISEEASFELFRRFGFMSGAEYEKFDGFDDCMRLENGTLAITRGTNAYICAHINERIDLGSHVLIIATVTKAVSLSDAPSASYGYYHTNIKPKPQPKSEETEGKTVWRCAVCGYEYIAGELPDGYTCPVCHHGKEDFEKV